MRIRAALAAVAAVLLLGACSREAGPTPERGAPDPGPGALRVKIDALTVDPCFRTPAKLPPPSCEKYVTQLASVPGRAEQYAGSEHPELAKAGRRLAEGISAYRDRGCVSDEAGRDCTDALRDIAAAMRAVEDGVAALPR